MEMLTRNKIYETYIKKYFYPESKTDSGAGNEQSTESNEEVNQSCLLKSS